MRPGALWLALVVLVPAAAAQPATPPELTPLPEGGKVGVPNGDGTFEWYTFTTLPDTTVRVEAGGRAVVLPVDILLDIADPYDGTVVEAPLVSQRGYGVEDGELTFYYGRRLPLGVVFGLLALGVAALVALGVWAAFRIRRDARRKAELAAFRETLASGREDERLRLARELHDGALQEFNAVRLALEATGAPEVLRADLLAAIQEVRGVVQDLRPPALERGGLGEALEGLAVRFRRRHPGLYVEAEVDGDGSTLPREDQLAVYRVCQEALTNVAKHGNASAVWVGYREVGGEFVLTVEDDGVGFDPSRDAAALVGHFGLAGIRERAEAIGADVRLASRRGRGTTLTLACRPA